MLKVKEKEQKYEKKERRGGREVGREKKNKREQFDEANSSVLPSRKSDKNLEHKRDCLANVSPPIACRRYMGAEG